MRRLIVMAALAAGLAGCATTYGEIGGWEGDGVSADRLTSDTFRIRGRGTARPDPALVQDFVMLRAAETMRAHCFSHFVVLEGADRTEVDEGSTPEEHTTRIVEKVVDGKTEKVVTRSFTPGTSWVTVRPGQDVIVRGLRAPAGPDAIAAAEVLAFVGPRVVRRKGEAPPAFPVCDAVSPRRS
jgi:hypothetical protein